MVRELDVYIYIYIYLCIVSMITGRRRLSHQPFDDEVRTDGGQIRFALCDTTRVSVSFISR